MSNSNAAVKAYAKEKGVLLYEIASRLGLRPQEFSVQYMRNPMAEETEAAVRRLIDAIAMEKAQ